MLQMPSRSVVGQLTTVSYRARPWMRVVHIVLIQVSGFKCRRCAFGATPACDHLVHHNVSDLHEHMLPLVSSSSHYGAQSARQLSPPGQTNRVVVHVHLFIRLFIIALQKKTTMRYTWLFMTEERTCRQVELCLGKAIVPHRSSSSISHSRAVSSCCMCFLLQVWC